MSPLNPPLTKNDFISTCWEDVVNKVKFKDCLKYSQIFLEKAHEAQKVDNYRDEAVFYILESVTSVEINPKSTEQFFAEHFKNISQEQLDFLTEIAREISDPELQARVADILWIKKHNYQMAQLAISAYLASATTLLQYSDYWTHCADRIERALRLTRKNRWEEEEEKVFAHIETVLNEYHGEDSLCLSERLMELLQDHKLGTPDKYAPFAENAANRAELSAKSANNRGESSLYWELARKLWDIKVKWHHLESNIKAEVTASMKFAETYVKEAECALHRDPPSYMLASDFFQSAIKAFRDIRGTKEEKVDAKKREEVIHKRLLQCQEKIPDEMIVIYHEVPSRKREEEKARNYVKDKSLQDALFALVCCLKPADIFQLRQQVTQRSGDLVLSHIFPISTINEMGKTVASQLGSVQSKDPNEAESATLCDMYRKATCNQHSLAQVYIEPARYQINLDHDTQFKDIHSIMSSKPFIPPERQYLFAKGLYAGLMGDFFTSTHILIPQIENSVRYLFQRNGIITSSLDDRGIQNEHNLNSTLSCPEIDSIFDKNTIFDLKCLLVEHDGSNLRNRMAHGLINDSEFTSSPLMSYLWWLTLRLCFLTK